MRTEENYPTPILGISTLAPRNRMYGHAGEQINFRSDPVQKLTRRPPMTWEYVLDTNIVESDILNHSYEKDGTEYRLLLNKSTGVLKCFVNNVLINTLQAPTVYLGSNIVTQTIEDNTYFVNTDKVVQLDTTTDTPYYASMLNVTAALNYSETVTVIVKRENTNGTVATNTVSHSVPSLGVTDPDYDAADEARAVAKVAEELSTKLNAVSGITSSYKGSCISVVTSDPTLENLTLEVATGQGDKSVAVINSVVTSTEGFPKYARVDTLVRVEPDPTSDDGAYFLKAQRAGAFVTGDVLEEIVWVEGRSPDEPYALDSDTTPFVVTYANSAFTVDNIQFMEREVGDNKSNTVPDFVGHTIKNVAYFQKRLVLLSEANAIMSETDEPTNFWRQSAVSLVVSDRVSIASSAVGTDTLQQAVPHNKDLLIIASNAQFKISGEVPVTPETVSMNLTTTIEVNTDVSPVSMGSSVYLPIAYGSSAGIQEYTAEDDNNIDVPKPITDHVIGMMEGDIKLLAASANTEMMAATSTGGPKNRIYLYEQYTKRTQEKAQQSWSYWDLPSTDTIVDLEFRRGVLNVLTLEGTVLIMKKIKIYSRVADNDNEVYLDNMLTLDTTGTSITLPDNYDTTDIMVVQGTTTFPLAPVQFTLDDRTITFSRNVGVGSVYVGKPFRSSYSPTRPFKYDNNGIAIFNNKIRIARFYLDLVDTHELCMSINSEFYEGDDQEFTARTLGNLNSLLGTAQFYTGVVPFAFSQEASRATATFYTESHLGVTIAGIGWMGQWTARAGRL